MCNLYFFLALELRAETGLGHDATRQHPKKYARTSVEMPDARQRIESQATGFQSTR
jgi:hypothetical protein